MSPQRRKDAKFRVFAVQKNVKNAMNSTRSGDKTKLWKISTSFGNILLMRARYVKQRFARHSHEDFPLGVIEEGALGFEYRGEHLVAPEGTINLANPGEAHTGKAAVESGWTYRMFYFELDVMQRIASEIAGRPVDIPFFHSGILEDPHLAAKLRRLHYTLEHQELSELEAQSQLLETLTELIQRHSDNPPPLQSAREAHQAVRRAKDYIESAYTENFNLEDLANVAYLSPFHLSRVFLDDTGLPPHAYLNQIRITKAKELLAQGRRISDVAHELGFVDQSHFHRRFKAIVGMTPGQYRSMM